ncbi:MAG: S-layer homology domain-containing protein, partial [Epulopiscium sp.]|nr:S-layer homology domain-containing protein [Candidatus Epulonipiscium sp.]
IGMDLASIKEINNQAKTDVNLTATRTDTSHLNEDAKQAIGSRPVFGLKVNYDSDKYVQNFGSGSVSVAIPYALGANEKAENVKAVYVDDKGKVHWLENSTYDIKEKVLRFSTNHFSIYGIGYRQTSTSTTFTDISNHWAKEDIEIVVNRGLFSGTSATTFSPNMAMTRGMFVTTLGRLENADVSAYTKSSFSDVKSDAYYMGYIEWANKNNVVTGVGDNKFAPEQSITREQMAVIMSNYAKASDFTMPKVHTENTFADNAKISIYAKEAVKQMQMAGVLSGKNGNLFDPQGTATRAEVSAVLRRFMDSELQEE